MYINISQLLKVYYADITEHFYGYHWLFPWCIFQKDPRAEMFLRCYTITPRRDFTERRVSTKGDSGLENKQNKQNTQTSATEMGGNGEVATQRLHTSSVCSPAASWVDTPYTVEHQTLSYLVLFHKAVPIILLLVTWSWDGSLPPVMTSQCEGLKGERNALPKPPTGRFCSWTIGRTCQPPQLTVRESWKCARIAGHHVLV